MTLAIALALSACTLNTAQDHYVKGQIAASRGQTDLALAELTAAINEQPRLSVALLARGDILKAQGNYEKAATDYEAASKVEPYNFSAHYQLGLMMQYLSRFGEAIRAYQKAAEIKPLDPDLNMNIAMVYTQMGEPYRGVAYAERAVAGSPNSATTHANLGILYAQLGDNEKAVVELKRSVELNSTQPQVFLNLGQIYTRQERYEAAQNVLENAQRIAPSPEVSVALGYAFFKQGKIDDAIAAYNEALKLEPKQFAALNGLGVMYVARGIQAKPRDDDMIRRGVSFWKRSLAIEPQQPTIKQLVDKYSAN